MRHRSALTGPWHALCPVRTRMNAVLDLKLELWQHDVYAKEEVEIAARKMIVFSAAPQQAVELEKNVIRNSMVHFTGDGKSGCQSGGSLL